MSSKESSPAKASSQSSTKDPVDLLSTGLLEKFSNESVKELEMQLNQIIGNQESLLQNILGINANLLCNDELMEVQLMMKKLNLYRMKLKKIKSEMLYIRSTSQSLLSKAVAIQEVKVNEKAERVRKIDYEINLVGKGRRTGESSS